MPRKKVPHIIDGVEHWECALCGVPKTPNNFFKNKSNGNGLTCRCKVCFTSGDFLERNKVFAAKRYVEKREEIIARAALWGRKNRKNPREIARRKLRKAVSRGKVVKPDNCSKCGIDGVRICGHHDDYTNPLDVVWLCDSCHGLEHRKQGSHE